MLNLRPLSILGARLPQVISWFYDPSEYSEPFLKKMEELKNEIRPITLYSYCPPAYKPSIMVKEGAKKLS